MKKLTLISLLILPSLLTGCFTRELLSESSTVKVNYSKNVPLFDDEVIAFGKPTQNTQHINTNHLVIVGQKNSYVLTQGGDKFYQLLTENSLDAKHFQIIKELTFVSKNNDGTFNGTLPLSYVKLVEDIRKEDRAFFIQNGATECSSSSDLRLGSQRFCFNIPLAGMIYPTVNNLEQLSRFKKPYTISIQTTQLISDQKNKDNPMRKLVLFPFAVAFDIMTLPIQIADKILE